MIQFTTEKIIAFKSVCPLCDEVIILESQSSSTNKLSNHIVDSHDAKSDKVRFQLNVGITQDEMDLKIARKQVIDLLETVRSYKERVAHLERGGK